MRLRFITATFAIGGSMVVGQTSPPQPNAPKQAPAVKGTTPPLAKEATPAVPPVLQQYDFGSQIRALETSNAVATGKVKPVFVRADVPKMPRLGCNPDQKCNSPRQLRRLFG